MQQPFLLLTLVQTDIIWEDKAANLARYEQLIQGIEGEKEVVVLPEMFSTGFSMAPERLAETMSGPTVQWMQQMSAKHRIVLTGSVMIEEEGYYYNRLIWMQPDGKLASYDKRHLFGYGEEDKHYTAGDKRLIVQVKGWRICPLVCYDLRFPVWARQQDTPYDVLLYVANWPAKRSLAWKTLLQARAIENQCYTVGVNRIGEDAHTIQYTGNSTVVGPLGEILYQQEGVEAVHTIRLEKTPLLESRAQFPFLKDADRFLLPNI